MAEASVQRCGTGNPEPRERMRPNSQAEAYATSQAEAYATSQAEAYATGLFALA